MTNDLSEINRIESLTQEYFNKGEIRLGLKTYRTLLEMCPEEKIYYLNYIGFLLDEFVIVELLWSSYEEAIACCNRALREVKNPDKEGFYAKKTEIYLLMIGVNPEWYRENRTEIESFIESSLEKYPENTLILKCALSLFSINGTTEKYDAVLDQLLVIHPDDFMLIIQKVVRLEEQSRIEDAVSLLENWISINPGSGYLSTAYTKIISLSKLAEDFEKAEHYQDVLDNL
ncbi:hypothetical protein VUJ46_01305 [Chryseobacterium sp. MYb264]|uniref:hypothetical protein n=1 Tax=Chryseobacterium sp. MYb264 TaxID=2745153 RepID=UPI002E10156E|nr:hypothetical protein VUJ46_01305 [Chryseobacterium sp. MYb264]